MAETLDRPKAADSLAVAKAGDHVWFFDSQRSLYVSGEYRGRGVWSLVQIQDETKQSFMLAREKFDRKTGYARSSGGYNTGNIIAGEKERIDYEWLQSKHKICRMVDQLTDADVLRRVAEIVGFNLPK